MQTYLQRYLDGEYIDVWAELVGLGVAIRDKDIILDAQAVAKEMMNRAKKNICILYERLESMKYRFVYPNEALLAPDSKRLSFIKLLEKQKGPFPLSISMFCEIVGSVNFMGAHPKLCKCDGYDWGGSEKLQGYGDPLVVCTLDRGDQELLYYYINRAESEEEEMELEEKNPPPYGLEIGLSAINKAGQSGGGGVDMLVPNPAFDAPLLDSDGYWNGTFFVPYLRECFKFGGFPGFQGKDINPEIETLKKDLLPL
jgi:hypothetical protein